MEKKDVLDKMNTDAMQIILHAGDARKMLQDVIDALVDGADTAATDKLIESARHELLAAHNLQTENIQSSVTEEDQITCLLFTHAQDTLMTINSEMLLIKNMVKIYRKLEGDIKHD